MELFFYLFFVFSDFNSGNGEPTNETDAVAIQTNSNEFNYIAIAGKGIRFIRDGLISHTTYRIINNHKKCADMGLKGFIFEKINRNMY